MALPSAAITRLHGPTVSLAVLSHVPSLQSLHIN